jgi:FAD/FMN-containing dehydrogenase
MLEMRQLGGALSRPPADLNPMGHSDAAYIMNGIGVTFTPEMAQAVQAYLAYVAEAAKPYVTGATYVNFMDLDGASPERVKAAYSPEDWKRLVELKDRRDPDNLFRYNRNIPPSSAEVAV